MNEGRERITTLAQMGTLLERTHQKLFRTFGGPLPPWVEFVDSRQPGVWPAEVVWRNSKNHREYIRVCVTAQASLGITKPGAGGRWDWRNYEDIPLYLEREVVALAVSLRPSDMAIRFTPIGEIKPPTKAPRQRRLVF